MIYRKLNYAPLTHNRYEQEFEYMFVLSKGKPLVFNPIKVPSKYGGTQTWGKPKFYANSNADIKEIEKGIVIAETKIKGNIFEYKTGSVTNSAKYNHPAMFPEKLAEDQIISWSNENDLVYDPFMGSGTTAIACLKNNRNYIGSEISEEYIKIANSRILDYKKTRGVSLF
jgi:site-specific DNA-methyltransferase (adenine-specific)